MVRVAKTKANLTRCRCIRCPTDTFACKLRNVTLNLSALLKDLEKTDHVEAMFCAFGKSRCITEKKGCLCPTCPVYKEFQLDMTFYCLNTETP